MFLREVILQIVLVHVTALTQRTNKLFLFHVNRFYVPPNGRYVLESGIASWTNLILDVLVDIDRVLSEIFLGVEYFRAYVTWIFSFLIPYFDHFFLLKFSLSITWLLEHQLKFLNLN